MGDPIRITAPAALPLSLAELKAHTRVEVSDDDPLVMGYLRAAVEYVEQYTGLGLINQTWQQSFPAFSSRMTLYRRPLQAVDSVAYQDTSDVEQTLASTAYRVAGIGNDKSAGWLSLASGQSWPSPYVGGEPVTVTYTVGFGATHNDVPELIRHAIMLVVATWYDYRADLVAGSVVAEMPMASRALLNEWRPPALA